MSSAILHPKRERLEARLTRTQKKNIERAARIKGTSVSDFVVWSADEIALRTIREQEVLVLAEESRMVFAKHLLAPPEPNRRLKGAASRFQSRSKR